MGSQSAEGGRVLVVDDEEMIRRVLSDILSGFGLHVSTAASGEEALRVFDEGGFALTVTDRNMPGMGGGELARRLKTRFPGHRVLMISGMAREESASEEGDVDGFLTKPFSRAEVLDGVGRVLGWESGRADEWFLAAGESLPDWFGLLGLYALTDDVGGAKVIGRWNSAEKIF